MGILKLPSLQMYWDAKSKLFSIQGIRKIITKQRFSDIYTCLIFRNSAFNSENNLSKFESLFICVISNSQFFYKPGPNLSVDESIIPFKGRSSLKVFMPQKPTRFGLKAYVLCEASIGYVLNWTLHTGDVMKSENQGVTQKIVMRLVDGFEGENYNIYMDRYYTSLPLLLDLKDIKINACGTIQKNRLRLNPENKKK